MLQNLTMGNLAANKGSTGLGIYDILQSLSLTTNLKMCVDAGDERSYNGIVNRYKDLSGNGTDWYLGSSDTIGDGDPTFHGSIDGKSVNEYWNMAGSVEKFTSVFASSGATNPSWVKTLHKDNAKLTVLIASYCTSNSAINKFLSTNLYDSGTGFSLIILNGDVTFHVSNAGSIVFSQVGGVTVPSGSWAIWGFTLNEATGASGYTKFSNGSKASFNSTYASPSASDPATQLRYLSDQNGNGSFASTWKFGWTCIWDTDLSSANLDSIYALAKTRYGL